jgi:hypothetical protein
MYARTYVCVYACMHVRMHVRTYVCMHACMCVCTEPSAHTGCETGWALQPVWIYTGNWGKKSQSHVPHRSLYKVRFCNIGMLYKASCWRLHRKKWLCKVLLIHRRMCHGLSSLMEHFSCRYNYWAGPL